MPTFIDTGEEYLNAAHIISIDTLPGDETIWIRLDTGERLPRSRRYLQNILEALNIQKPVNKIAINHAALRNQSGFFMEKRR